MPTQRERSPQWVSVLLTQTIFDERLAMSGAIEMARILEKPEPILLEHIYDQITALGSMHRAKTAIHSP